MEDMTIVFDRCQMNEAQRLQTFKEVLFTVQKCLNISDNPMYLLLFLFSGNYRY